MRSWKVFKGSIRIPLLKISLVAFLILISCQSECYNFKLEPFNFEGKGLMGDFGDFNNSGSLNYATYSYNSIEDKTTVYIYSQIKEQEVTKPYKKFDVDGECDGLTASDLDSDNHLDIILIMKRKEISEDTPQSFYLLLYSKKGGEFVDTWDSRTSLDTIFKSEENKHKELKKFKNYVVSNNLHQYSTIHPLIADFDGDGTFDIMVQTTDYRLFFWINFEGTFLPFYKTHLPSMEFVGNVEGYIPHPHSSAFIDMDGDCRPDLVLIVESRSQLTTKVQIWLAGVTSNSMTYTKWHQDLALPKHHGMVTFGDYDNDGTNDLLVPFCNKVDSDGECQSQCQISLSFNKQIPFCPQMFKTSEQECRSPDNMCVHSNMTFTWFTDKVIDLPSDYRFISPLKTSGVIMSNKYFNDAENKEDPYGKLPTTLATVTTGDLNFNGFLDLIVPVKLTKEHKQREKKINRGVLIIKNTSKEKQNCVYQDLSEILLDDIDEVVTHVTTADIVDRRSINLLVFVKLGEKTRCYYHSLYKENIDLFMKAMTKYTLIDESKYPENYFLTGSNNNGMTYKLTVIDINGIKTAKITTIRPQTAHSPLYTPYTIIGLGKTNNYVEEFYMGLSSRYKNYFHMWISIIPSCTVITLPIPLDTPSKWSLKLSIIPGKKLYIILMTSASALILFGLVILIFDLKEKREDFIQAKGFRQKFIIN